MILANAVLYKEIKKQLKLISCFEDIFIGCEKYFEN